MKNTSEGFDFLSVIPMVILALVICGGGFSMSKELTPKQSKILFIFSIIFVLLFIAGVVCFSIVDYNRIGIIVSSVGIAISSTYGIYRFAPHQQLSGYQPVIETKESNDKK